MTRRGLTAAMLVVLAVQLLGGMALANVCPEPCPDDTEGSSCPPICNVCTSCTHAQSAIVQHDSPGTPLLAAHRFMPQQLASTSSPLTADIFHVPLLG